MSRRAAESVDSLLPLVYQELRRLAASYLRREKPGQTLQPTALVNEAYLRLLKDRPDRWQNRAHFCAIAAHSMRQILIERARARHAQKRGGVRARVTLDDALVAGGERSIDLIALDEALERLAQLDPGTGAPDRAPVLRWAHHRRDRRGNEHLPRHRQTPLDGGAGVAGARAWRVVTPERWKQVNALFHEVLDRDPAAATTSSPSRRPAIPTCGARSSRCSARTHRTPASSKRRHGVSHRS